MASFGVAADARARLRRHPVHEHLRTAPGHAKHLPGEPDARTAFRQTHPPRHGHDHAPPCPNDRRGRSAGHRCRRSRDHRGGKGGEKCEEESQEDLPTAGRGVSADVERPLRDRRRMRGGQPPADPRLLRSVGRLQGRRGAGLPARGFLVGPGPQPSSPWPVPERRSWEARRTRWTLDRSRPSPDAARTCSPAGHRSAGSPAPRWRRPSLSHCRSRRPRNRSRKTCRKQIGACQAAVAAFCARTTQSEPEPCGVALLPCRAAFKGCKAGDFYACLTDALLVLAKSPPT